MANLKLIYDLQEVETTYNAPQNYEYGDLSGWLDLDDREQSATGNLNSLAGARKRKYELHFSNCLKAQLDDLTAIWALKGPVDLYLNGVDLDAAVKIMAAPEAQLPAVFDPATGAELYDFDLIMEEI